MPTSSAISIYLLESPEVNCEETNYLFGDEKTNDFWKGYDEHADQVFYDSE
ncbi:27366_t:CDS:2 [Gigaspora margarita]|uniref:27366_t:CDS:1 n=1 Tax=Gigaspora margarita TaxID=4874 RepID=A0ABN7VLT8_GIGMA|nr:27366_t:CDS:2 [Gigaspora margarita]